MAYLYRHIRLDKNVPFYIGIGNDSSYKRAFDKSQRNRHWKFVINKTPYEVEILLDELSWDEACEKEKEFINLYGRKDNKTGILVNMTNGGDGGCGIVVSQETKDRISKANKGKIFSEETKKKLSAKAKGRKYSSEIVKRMSERGKIQKHSEERNKKISESLKRIYASGERVSAMIGRPVSDETKDKLRITSSGRTHTEETKKKMSENMMGSKRNLGKKLSEETKRKISASNKGKIRTEETKLKLSLSHLGKPSPHKGKKIGKQIKAAI